MNCSYEGCDFQCYDRSDFCIFHHDKQDWLTDVRRDWKSNSEEKIKYFWNEIRRLRNHINRQYKGFVFPKFEDLSDVVHIDQGRHQVRSHYIIDNYSFGYRGSYPSYYSILENANFEDATFLDVADFSKIYVNYINFKNTIFNKGILFSQDRLDNIVFDNVNFKIDMTFDKFTINNCKFINNTFSNNINFNESSFANTNFENSTFEYSLNFENTRMSGASNFTNTTFKEEANFENGSFDGDVDFTGSVFESDALFSGREIKSNAKFQGITVIGKANFDLNNIQGNANFSESIFEKDTTFKDVQITGEANFTNTTFKEEANFENGSFDGDVDFTGSVFESDAIFINRKFNAHVKFNKVRSNKIDLTNTYFAESDSEDFNYDLEFIDGKYGILDFSNSTIGQDLISKKSGFWIIKFHKTTINQFGSIEFRDIEVDNFIFNKYVNESESILFDFVTVHKKLEIKDVAYDKEKFNHFNISTANVEINNSSFNSGFFNSVKWGTITENRYKATRDIFRQLKFHSEQQKNFIDADGFYSLEMKERKKELKIENKKLKGFDKISHFFSHTIVFYIHEKTSDFSQSWIMPIYWIFVLGMLGVIWQHKDHIQLANIVPVLLIIFVVYLFVPPIYKSIASDNKLPIWIIYGLISLPVIAIYYQVSNDYLDDIAKLINPSNVFKSKKEHHEHEFIFLLYKIAVMFLIYQAIIATKKKVRSK